MAFHFTMDPRNLGSQASSTVQPTADSTIAPPAASTTSSSTTNTGGSGIFTANSSPPLIVAFLAIGLFMAATIAVFGWRRMYMNRGLTIAGYAGGPRGGVGGVRRRGEEFGEKPELWDLWTREPTRDKESMKWESIMVSLVFEAIATKY